ncbi:hypothetical protein MTP99_008043 [Tenebrio molitor]|nr:hypothetical protein MTP99_008043 [Tenebrio molitor]
MEGALFKKVVTTALFCRPNKRSPDEPSETEAKADISSFQWRPLNFFLGTIFSYTTEKIQRQFTNWFTCKKPNPSKMTEHRRL